MDEQKSPENDEGKPDQLNPIDDLEYLKRRISEEREKEARKLDALGKWESDIDWQLDAHDFMKSAGITPDDQK